MAAYIPPMFAEFLTRLMAPAPTPLPDTDARLALSALLVRVAKTDGHYDASEKAHIDAIIAKRFGLDAAETATLHADAEQLELEAPDTVRFTRAIKDAVEYDDRLGVIEALWQVALADGVRTQEEDALLRLTSNLLGVSDRDSALARQRMGG